MLRLHSLDDFIVPLLFRSSVGHRALSGMERLHVAFNGNSHQKTKKNNQKKVGTNCKLKFKRMFLYFCLEKYFIKKKKENELPYFQFCHSKSVLEICFCFTFCEETFFEVNFIGRFPPLPIPFSFSKIKLGFFFYLQWLKLLPLGQEVDLNKHFKNHIPFCFFIHFVCAKTFY